MTYRSGTATPGSLVPPPVFREAFVQVRRLRLDVRGARSPQSAAHEPDAAEQDQNPESIAGALPVVGIRRGVEIEIRPRAPDGRPDQADHDGRDALER